MKNNPSVQLSFLIHEILKVFRKHHFKDLEEKLNQIATEDPIISCPAMGDEKCFIPELEIALEKISSRGFSSRIILSRTISPREISP